LFVAKVAIHPREDLAKTGYKPDMKTKTFNHPSTSLATKCFKPNIKIWKVFTISYPSLLVIENIQTHFVINFFILNVANKRTLRFNALSNAFFFGWLIYLEKFFKKKIYKILPFLKNFRPKSKKNLKSYHVSLHIVEANSHDIKGF
jgi:hypothetical protein